MPFSGFFRVKTPSQVYPMLERFGPLRTETVPLDQTPLRILAEDIVSPIHLPPFDRSTVDGYALQARDTFGASEGNPVPFKLVGEVLMGESTEIVVSSGEAAKIPTGGMIPQGADAVLMLEFSEPISAEVIGVKRPVSPLENVIQQGEDIKRGERILCKGQKIRPQDMGAMAALGKSRITVYEKPKVAIVSSGDEIVHVDAQPRLGEIRDVNRYSLSGQVELTGGIPLFVGIAKDSFEDLKSLCDKGLRRSDMLIISGGSSVGSLDYTTDVIRSFPESEIMVHGVSLRPGKPTIIARSGTKPVLGLPGHPVSAMVVFDLFLRPLIWRLAGYSGPLWPREKRVRAVLTRNVSSPPGREDYIRVKAEEKDGQVLAHPLLGKSGAISTMVKANGLIKVDIDSEGLEEGASVEVLLF